MLSFSWAFFFFFFFFHFTRSVVEDNHSLMGGSADALHLGGGSCFLSFSAPVLPFSRFPGVLGSWFFYTTPWGVSRGLDTKPSASDVTMFLLERVCLTDRACRVH